MKSIQLIETMEQTGQGLQLDKIHSIRKAFYNVLEGWDEVQDKFELLDVVNEPTFELSAQAKELRLQMVKMRTSTEKTRKLEKADCVKVGKTIDMLSNLIKQELQPREERLKQLEDYEKIKEENRLQQVQEERINKIYALYEKYNEPIFLDAVNTDYRHLEETIFSSTLVGMEEKIRARQEEAKEFKRQQDIRYQDALEKQRVENEKLKLKVEKEKVENEKLLAERERFLKESKSKDEEAARDRRILAQKLLEEQQLEQKRLEEKHNEEVLKAVQEKAKKEMPSRQKEAIFWKKVLVFMETTREDVDGDLDYVSSNFQEKISFIRKAIEGYLS